MAYKPRICLSPYEWYPNNEQSYVYGLTISAKLNLPSTEVRHTSSLSSSSSSSSSSSELLPLLLKMIIVFN
jgi:hypothetical protein